MRISDWSSDVCSSDLLERKAAHVIGRARGRHCSGSESIARLGKIWCKRGAVRLSQSRYASGDRGKERHHAQQTLLNGEDVAQFAAVDGRIVAQPGHHLRQGGDVRKNLQTVMFFLCTRFAAI